MQTWPGRCLKGRSGPRHVAERSAGTFLQPYRLRGEGGTGESPRPGVVHAMATALGTRQWPMETVSSIHTDYTARALLEPGRCRLHYQSPLTEELEELV